MDRRVELAGFLLAVLGWICTIVTWQMPMWYVTGTVDNNTDTLALYWNGVWLNWQELSKGSLHCNFYMSLLSLAEHFRSRRALIISSMAIGILPVLIYLIGLLKFPQFVLIKATAGLVYVMSGLLLLVVVSWTTHVTQGSLNTDIHLTTDWGPALYSGWVGTVLLLVGGGILCIYCCTAPIQVQRGPVQTQAAPEDVDHPLNTIQRTAYDSPYRQTTSPI